MQAEYKNRTNVGVVVGILLHIVAGMMISHAPLLAGLLALAGSVFFIWGCCNYAMGKGHSWAIGLLGALSCIGLIILIVLPNRS